MRKRALVLVCLACGSDLLRSSRRNPIEQWHRRPAKQFVNTVAAISNSQRHRTKSSKGRVASLKCFASLLLTMNPFAGLNSLGQGAHRHKVDGRCVRWRSVEKLSCSSGIIADNAKLILENGCMHQVGRSGSVSMTALESQNKSGDDRSARVMKWTASAAVSEPCEGDGPVAEFLAAISSSDLIVRVDDSVVACTPVNSSDDVSDISGGRGQRYLAQITPLRMPGLTVEPMAVIRVERVPDGLRYTTERCDNEYSGIFSRIVARIRPEISAYTELRAESAALVADAEFILSLPLPAWWPIPDRTMAAGGALIRRLVEKDTRLSIKRIKDEYEAWCAKQRLEKGSTV